MALWGKDDPDDPERSLCRDLRRNIGQRAPENTSISFGQRREYRTMMNLDRPCKDVMPYETEGMELARASLKNILVCAVYPDEWKRKAESAATGVPVYVVSTQTGAGLEELFPYFHSGRIVALLGSSGTGKSTLINALLGEERLRTREVREKDARGRDTTTHRQMVPLPALGGVILDTLDHAGDAALAR